MKLLERMLGVAALLVITACSGDGGPTDPDEDESTFTASVSSVSFTGENFSTPILTGNALSFWVSQVVDSGNTHRFDINLAPIAGEGTFALGPSATSLVVYVEVGSGGVQRYWRSSLTGGGGSITVTTSTSERVAGNFSFTLGPDTGSTGTKTVTGSFNIFR